MLRIGPSNIVPGALGAFASEAVPAGAVIDSENASFLSQHFTAVDVRRHNERFAWSVVDEILKAHPVPKDVATLVAALRHDRYASGLGNQKWEQPDGDERALRIIASAHGQDPALVRALYDFMATNIIIARETTIRVPVAGREPILLGVAARHGFFPRFSRINHACEPNATLAIPMNKAGPVVLRALRPIAAHEEVTFNYLGPAYDAATARVKLYEQFGFCCTCARCRSLCRLLVCDKKGDKACPCRHAAYCSAAHQILDWPRHKTEDGQRH